MKSKKTFISIKLVTFVLLSSWIIAFAHPQVTLDDVRKHLEKRTELDILLFAPDQAKTYKEILLWLMETTDFQIQAALYRLTDRDVMNGLSAAYKRGVKVEIVFDPGAATSGNYSLGLTLCKAGVPTYVYQPHGLSIAKAYPSIMHHKTFIFTNKKNRQPIVAYGSLNPTGAGFNGNEEAMQIRNKDHIVGGFKEQFQNLKERSRFMDENQAKQLSGQKSSMAFIDSILKSTPILRRMLHR